MRAVFLVLLVGALVACGGTSPRFAVQHPMPLPPAAVPVEASTVRLAFPTISMWESNESRICLGSDESISDGAVRIGAVRSRNIELGTQSARDVVCGWIDDEHCGGTHESRVRSRPLIAAALESLQQQAAAAGATAVASTKCFRMNNYQGDHLWCEGDAVRDDVAPTVRELDKMFSHRFDVRPSTWTVSATFTAGMFGKHPVKGTTLGVARNASEIAFHMVAPFDDAAAALGVETLHGFRFGSVMARGGLSALYMTQLGGEMAMGRGTWALEPKLALSYHLDQWPLFNGFARMFGELRAGYTFALRDADLGGKELNGPSLEVAIGFRSF
jgi:hypothetical protein